MATSKGIEQLKKDEGFTPKASHLKKQQGGRERILTIGYGYNINAAANPKADLIEAGVPEEEVDAVLSGDKKISKDQGELLFNISVQRAINDASRVIPGFEELDPELRDVFVNMSYQLGATGLRSFKRMRSNLVKGDYEGVAKEILNSKFARSQASSRADRLAQKVVAVGKRINKEQPQKQIRQSAEDLFKQFIKGNQTSRLQKTINREYRVERVVNGLTTMAARKEEEAEEKDSAQP